MPGVAESAAIAHLADELQHPLPLGEDDHLGVVLAAFVEDALQLGQLGAGALVGIEDEVGVADHPHHGQLSLEFFLFLLGERAAQGEVDESEHLLGVGRVGFRLLLAHRHEIVAIGALGQLCLHLRFSPSEQTRFNARVKHIEIAVADRPAAVVELVEIAVSGRAGPGWTG